MPVNILTNRMKVRSNGQYVNIDFVADATTQERISQINSAGTTQVSTVNSAGTTNITNINNAGQTQINNIEAQGQRVLNSIPDDYEALSADVTALKNKKDQDISAGSAEQLLSNNYVKDQTPYMFRQTGGGVDVGTRAIEQIIGGTVYWNQLVNNTMATTTVAGITMTNNTDGSFTLNGTTNANSGTFTITKFTRKLNHKYLCKCYGLPDGAANNTFYFGIAGLPVDTGNGGIINASSAVTTTIRFDIGATEITFDNVKIIPQVFDLTAMFGSEIADYIYNLDQATAGAGVAWFRSLFPKDYYTYNPGELMSVKAVVHQTVGRNLWDEVWELGSINENTGQNVGSSTQIRSKNYNACLPKTQLYSCCVNTSESRFGIRFYDLNKNFISSIASTRTNQKVYTTPDNAYYFRLTCIQAYGTVYNHDICINFSDPSFNGQYEPYKRHTYLLDPSLELRGIPKLDSNNKLYYDGDTYNADGTVVRRYGIVEITEDLVVSNNTASTGVQTTGLNIITMSETLNLITTYGALIPIKGRAPSTSGYIRSTGNRVFIYDNALTDLETAKTALTGHKLVYELVTPITEEAEPYQEVQVVDPYGTEEYIDVREVAIPVGHVTKYPVDQVKKLDGLPSNFGTLIAPNEKTTTASQNYAVGSFLIMDNQLYKVTSAITTNNTITPGTNVQATTIMQQIMALQ